MSFGIEGVPYGSLMQNHARSLGHEKARCGEPSGLLGVMWILRSLSDGQIEGLPSLAGLTWGS